MGVDHLQDEPKLILTYPHKSTFNRIGFSSMVSLSFIVLWILNHLMSYNTDFSDKIIMAIVLVGAPLLVWFMGYYLFINGVKLEIYENNIVKYYTYDTTSQSELCNRSISYLKKYCDIIYNYEVDIAILPDNVRIGDTINIIDENGELYLSARVLK